MRGASVLFALLLHCVKRTETGVAGSGKDHISALADLGQRQLFAFARIVPGRISVTDEIPDYADVWINSLRALLVAFCETVDQTDIHSAEKSDCSGARRFRGENADKIRTFMLFENERRHIWQLALTVDDRKLNVRIVFRYLFHDRRLRKTDADDQVEVS